MLVPLLNTINSVVKLLKNTVLGSIIKVDNAEYVQNICSPQFDKDKVHDRSQPPQEAKPLLPVFPDSSSFQTHAHDSNKSPIQLQDANVPLEIQCKLNIMLISKFTDIISKSPADFGRTNLIEIDLHTTGPPVSIKPYIIPLKYKSFQITQQWGISHLHLKEEAGSKSTSQASTPHVYWLQKINQSLVMVHNNSNGKVVSTFPLPKIQELLGRLNKCKYFSSLDLCSGYYHISLTEEAKKKTAFVTADGKYQWNVVPFGLATTVSTFQYLMSTVLTGLNNFAFMYLDDVFSETYDDHLHHLNTLFEKIQKKAVLKLSSVNVNFSKPSYII